MWRRAVLAVVVSGLVACGSRTSLDADGDLAGNNGGAPSLSGGRTGRGGAPPGAAGSGFAGSGVAGFAGGGRGGLCFVPEGTFLPGQTWISFDDCATCTCLAGGGVSCVGIVERCGCIAPNGQALGDGAVWFDPQSCTECYCEGGILSCTSSPDCRTCRAPDGSVLYPGEGWASDCEECWCEAGELFCEEFCEEPVCDPTPCGPTGCCLRNGECGHRLPNASSLCVQTQPSDILDSLDYCPPAYVWMSQQPGCCLPNGTCGVALGSIQSPSGTTAIACAEPFDIPVPPGPNCCSACMTDSCAQAELEECASTPGCLDTIRCLFELGCGEAYRNSGTITEECQDSCVGPDLALPPLMCSLTCDNVCPPP